MTPEQKQHLQNGLDQALAAANVSENNGNQINAITTQMIEMGEQMDNVPPQVLDTLNALQGEAETIIASGDSAATLVGQLKNFLS